MRCFVAIPFLGEAKTVLLRSMEQLRSQVISANFTRPENLHLTLAFLGEIQDIVPLCQAIDATAPKQAFPACLKGSGCFQALWWVGMGQNPTLESFALRLQNNLQARGFALERRPFQPHITIARQVTARNPISLTVPNTPMLVDRVQLMHSQRIAGKLVYTPLYQKLLSV